MFYSFSLTIRLNIEERVYRYIVMKVTRYVFVGLAASKKENRTYGISFNIFSSKNSRGCTST